MMRPGARRHGCRGLTLVELMFAGVIFLLIGGVALALTQSSDQAWRRMDAQIATMTQAQVAMNRLAADLRQAKRASGMADQLTCGPGSALAFTSMGGADVTYTLAGSNLVKQVGADPPQVMAFGVTAFVPTCSPGGPVVQLRLTAQVSTWHAPMTLTSQVWVQNP